MSEAARSHRSAAQGASRSPYRSVLASDATPRCASMASADRQMIGDATLGGDGAEHLGVPQQRGKRLGRRGVGEQAVDLAERGQLHHGRAVELAVVGGQPDLARVLDDGLRHLHLAVVEVAQRAVGLDARDADERDVHLELADEGHRRLAHHAPRPAVRAPPPATITSHSGVLLRMASTFRLLVITRRPRWCSSALAMASVVVPMFRISEQLCGTWLATARAMRALPSASSVSRCVWARFSTVEPGTRTPPWKRVSRPDSASRCTSRRTVCKVTLRVAASCSTVTDLRARTSSSSSSWRGFVFTRCTDRAVQLL